MATDKNFIVKNGLEVGGQEVISSSGVVTAAALGGQTLGTTDSPTFANTTLTGSLRGPSTFTIDPAAVGDNTGTLVIAGNLQVDGTTTTINSTTMEVDDLNITLASGAANAAAANGAGITVDGASATITYDSTNDEWDFNKDINVTGTVTATGLTVQGTATTRLTIGNSDVNTNGLTTGLDFKPISNMADGAKLNVINGLQPTAGSAYTAGFEFVTRDYSGTAFAQTKALTIGASGDISFYEDTGTTAKFFWDASAERLGIGNTSPATALDVTGTVTADGLTVGVNDKIQFGTSDITGIYRTNSGTDFTMQHWGNLSMLIDSDNNDSGTRQFMIGRNSQDASTATKIALFSEGGDISFYEDTGTTAKFFWDASAESLGIGTTSPSKLLHLKSADPVIRLEDSSPDGIYAEIDGAGGSLILSADQGNGNANSNIVFKSDNTEKMRIDSSGVVKLITANDTAGTEKFLTFGTNSFNRAGIKCTNAATYDGSLEFYTGNSTNFVERVRIDSSGRLLIGRNASVANANADDVQIGNTTGTHGITILSDRSSVGTIYFADNDNNDAGTITYDHSGNALRFNTNRSEAMRIDSSGLIGIGTSSPSSPLHISNSANSVQIRMQRDASNYWGLQLTGGNLNFQDIASSTTPMSIDSSGRVGIGTTSPAQMLELSADNGLSGVANVLRFNDSDTGVTASQPTGRIEFAENDGGNTTVSAYLEVETTGTSGGGEMTFGTGTAGVTATERMRIDSSGNVGIGTASPSKKLHIQDSTAHQLQLQGSNSYWNVGTGWSGYYQDYLLFATNTGEKMVIDTNGNVGIGTSSPSYKLHVVPADNDGIIIDSSSDSHTGFLYFGDATSNTVGAISYDHFSDAMRFKVNAAEKMRIDSSGNVGMGTTSPNARLEIKPAASSNYLQFNDSSDTEKFRIDSNFRWAWGTTTPSQDFDMKNTSGNDFFALDRSNGRVGIGTTSPSSKLSIAGNGTDVQFTYGSTVPNNPLHTAFYGEWSGIGMDQTTAGIRIAAEYLNNTSPIVDIGYYTSGIVSHANWVSKLKVQSNGNVGIGTTSPSAALHLYRATGDCDLTLETEQDSGAAEPNIYLKGYATNSEPAIHFGDRLAFPGLIKYDNVDDHMHFNTNSTERMRINSSGNVGIGTSSPEQILHLAEANAGGIGPQLVLDNNTSSNLNNACEISFLTDVGASSTGTRNARITAINTDAGTGAAALTFYTWSGSTDAERMRIDSNGALLVGRTTRYWADARLEVESNARIGNIYLTGSGSDSTLSAGNASFKISTLTATGGATDLDFDVNIVVTGVGIANRFKVDSPTGDTYTNDGTISSLSDIRVKTDINDLTDGLEIVKQLRPVTFKYNDNSTDDNGNGMLAAADDKIRYGFIAQEVEEVAPHYVETSTRKINNEEVDDFKSLSTTRMIPMLFKAIQEQQVLIEQLQAEVALLKGE